MASEEYEEEFEEIKKRRSGGFTSLIKNMSNWQFVSIIILVIIFIWLLGDKTTPKSQLFVIGFVILAILLYSQKSGASGLISKEVAKKIAVESLENEKEKYDIPSDADISTGFCRLERQSGEAREWHIGVKMEDRFGKIDYARVDIEPYLGIVTGVVKMFTEFVGNEMPDRVIVFPGHYMEEK